MLMYQENQYNNYIYFRYITIQYMYGCILNMCALYFGESKEQAKYKQDKPISNHIGQNIV